MFGDKLTTPVAGDVAATCTVTCPAGKSKSFSTTKVADRSPHDRDALCDDCRRQICVGRLPDAYSAHRSPSARMAKYLKELADPARFELTTSAFGGQRSIQLSYGSEAADHKRSRPARASGRGHPSQITWR